MRSLALALFTTVTLAPAMQAADKAPALKKGEKIIFLGDSITQGGVGPKGYVTVFKNQITEKNANQGQARILCEGANGPTTWQADAIIDAKGIFTVPDILGNAGGVTVSYFEWVQGLQNFFWTAKQVQDRIATLGSSTLTITSGGRRLGRRVYLSTIFM